MKRKLINWLLNRLLKVQNPKEILTVTKDSKMLFKGKEVTLKEVQKMADDLEIITRLDIYKILNESIINDAQALIFNKSNNFDDVLNGKMILWTIEQQKAYIQSIITKYSILKTLKDREDAIIKQNEKVMKVDKM